MAIRWPRSYDVTAVAKKKRARSQRRARERAARKEVRDLEKLAAAAPGGTPGRAIKVSTPAVIEPQVRSMRCPQCGVELEPAEVTARSTDAGLLRVATTRCRLCHAPREIWFTIGPTVN